MLARPPIDGLRLDPLLTHVKSDAFAKAGRVVGVKFENG